MNFLMFGIGDQNSALDFHKWTVAFLLQVQKPNRRGRDATHPALCI